MPCAALSGEPHLPLTFAKPFAIGVGELREAPWAGDAVLEGIGPPVMLRNRAAAGVAHGVDTRLEPVVRGD